MWSADRYEPHSELTTQKLKGRKLKEFLQKTRILDLKILKSAPVLPWMQHFLAKRQEEACPVRYLKGLKNENPEHLVNLCESNSFETQVIVMNWTEFYFNLKVQITKKLK